MKTLNVVLFFLLVFAPIAIAAEGKSPAVLLEEGIYAEETEGNLDKAMTIYNQIRKDYNDVERVSARATYQLGLCNLKKGDSKKAAELFQEVVEYYPQQENIAKMAQEQLDKLGIKKSAGEGGLFEILGPVNSYIGSKYGEICAEAGTKKLYSNSHIYLVDKDFVLHSGGMGYIYNWTSEPITKHHLITGTSYPNQKLYDITGNLMDIEIVPDNNRSNFYNIYWNPKEPIAPGGFFNYGWTKDVSKPLPNLGGGESYSLTMQNHFGQHCYETFFLVVPEGTTIASQSEEYANKGTVNDWDIYWWKKEVPDNNKNTVSVTLSRKKEQSLKLEAAPWVDGEIMELRLKRPIGTEYGMIIYSARKKDNNWQIISNLYVSQGSLSQYTLVEADADSFIPTYGQTTNWTGNFIAEYSKNNVKLTAETQDVKNTRDIPVSKVVYDNEQALYLIRRMPLAENYVGGFSIFTVQAGATVECGIKVLAVEDVNAEAGTFKCYKTELSIYSSGAQTLQHILWFSADEHKYLVKYDVGGAATMELAKIWQKNKDEPITFDNTEPPFSVTMPTDWRFYKYQSPGPQFNLQLMPPDNKAWAVLMWQKRGTDPDSKSAMTIAKADSEKLKGAFENYTVDQNDFKEIQINSLQAVQFKADYQEKGNRLKTYNKPQDMVEYRTYIVDASNVYWFVFRIEKENFEKNKAQFDSTINSFKIGTK